MKSFCRPRRHFFLLFDAKSRAKTPFPSGKPSRFCKPRWQLAAAAASCLSEKLEKVFDPRGKFAYVAQRLSAIGKRITVHTLGVKPDLLCNI